MCPPPLKFGQIHERLLEERSIDGRFVLGGDPLEAAER